MTFMQPVVTVLLRWYCIETESGTWYVPAYMISEGDDLLQYAEGTELWGVSEIWGYGARLSAPGYLDCTEWEVYDTLEEAEAAAAELEEDEGE